MTKSPLTILEEFTNQECCIFCNRNVIDTLSFGPVYKYHEIIAHYFCLLLSSNILQNGADCEGILGFLPEDIGKEVARAKKLLCSYCKKKGASIGCAVKSCKTVFHLPCGISRQALSLFYDKFPSFCYKHRNWVSLPNVEENLVNNKTCIICLEEISLPLSNITWSTCCKNAFYHKRCIQEVALNSGYYFRCPNCNSNESFRKQMLEFGIYIPNQDASWEREPNAYSDLYERHNHCDAPTCYCPRGRDVSNRIGSWKIILCFRCLQKGIHKRCGGNSVNKNLWSCSSRSCLNEHLLAPAIVPAVPETSSGIVTQNSALPSNNGEDKENFVLGLNPSSKLSNSSFHRRRGTAKVSVAQDSLTSLSSILCSHQERFTDRETRRSSLFAFNLPNVNSSYHHSFAECFRRRRGLRLKVHTMYDKKKSSRNGEVQRTEKCKLPKKSVKKYSTSSRHYNMRSKQMVNYRENTNRHRRRRYIIDKRVVSVYPHILRCIKDFKIEIYKL